MTRRPLFAYDARERGMALSSVCPPAGRQRVWLPLIRSCSPSRAPCMIKARTPASIRAT